ncbi:chromosome segregation protein SMC [Bifidobacterium jacchi]|uniref:Chromosome partition protein Smc n=1 Tax=Bifidobacterium jacchi TaxID=2490545 RepID=A0A5N5RHC3_9BIFI|nr:chromosome segregation protein SMC [Bifidobacterium jacchi]KAB5606668.1 chromosome segregation protein SMC [Bifidobacterium jacchi]
MYLKELTLKGFKSFASATTLRFEPGITAVVGPNGSGKSNIVDALTWVMGEQGAKNLRGTSMEDVIFAGTSSRPPLGRAQVTLTIDNADHTLDIDYTEVTISRTIFRNGGSEYAINGTPCRLLDIQELLSDTGLGQQMHVIVGQGRLDSILKADPSGHRAFIEEAAGILKHRKRKERALRKLANTQTNLSRIDDLLHEMHRRLGPLGRQARISRRADGIQTVLRDAQARILADDATRCAGRRDAVRADLTEVRGRLAQVQHDLAQVRVRIEQGEAVSAESSPAITRINQTWHELSRLVDRFDTLASLAGERSRSALDQMVTATGDDPALLNARADELAAQERQARAAVDEARLALDHTVERRADDERRLASVRQTLTELRRTTQERDAKIAGLRESIARAESSVQLAETRERDLTAQRDGLIAQRDEAIKQRDELVGRARQEDSDDGTAALDAARSALAGKADALNALETKLRELDGRVISLKAKADALADTLDSRSATDALEHADGIDVLGRLADYIQISEGWEEPVAHALGEFAGAVVVGGIDDVTRALTQAREERLGRAVALAAFGGAADAAAVLQSGAAVRPASAFVHVNPRRSSDPHAQAVAEAVRALLADVAAVDSLAEAVALMSDTQGDAAATTASRWRIAVTRDGELVNRVGASGGSAPATSDLALAARRDRALSDMETLDAGRAQLESRIARARGERDQARLAVDQASTRCTEIRVKAKQTKTAITSADGRIAALERQIAAMGTKISAVADERATHQRKTDELKQALDAVNTAQGPDVDSDELSARQRELESSLGDAREREIKASVAWNEAKRKAESLTRQIGLLRDQADEATKRRARIAELNEQRQRESERLQRIASDARAICAIVRRYADDAATRRDRLQQSASSNDLKLKELREQRNAIEPKVNELNSREHALDVERERLAAEYGQITQKISDALGMTIDETVRDYGPDRRVPVLDDDGRPVPIEERGTDHGDGEASGDGNRGDGGDGDGGDGDGGIAGNGHGNGDDANAYQSVPYVRAEQIKRLDKAKRDLAALGKVNPLAAEEYEALEERNRYLNEQRDDVAKSRDDLMTLIRDLDRTMIDVFRKAFDDTAAAFETMFTTLFPGGTGRLRLENPDDMLATGVIVEASPAGKRVKQLSLLSGGERSLTALALLFAIFTARPSPFYVMDEVEAALDDVNLTRLLNAFNKLREHAQLIVITHQQRTMSIADALYGVTMRADGVTAVVSQRLSGSSGGAADALRGR